MNLPAKHIDQEIELIAMREHLKSAGLFVHAVNQGMPILVLWGRKACSFRLASLSVLRLSLLYRQLIPPHARHAQASVARSRVRMDGVSTAQTEKTFHTASVKLQPEFVCPRGLTC